MRTEFTAVAAAVGAALILAAPTVSATPTYGDGDDFAQEVWDHGLLENYPKNFMVHLLANICYQAETLPSNGIPLSALVGLQMDGFGLSEKDATWLVNSALEKCN